MLRVIKKKNIEYSLKERRSTAVITFVIGILIGYVTCQNSAWFVADSFLEQYIPYLSGLILGLVTSFLAYKFPKVIHITLFMLPLMLIGN